MAPFTFRIFSVCTSVLLLSSCTDFFVRDISGDSVQLVAPSNGTSTISLTQQFIWEEISGAETYRLQVAYPDFTNLQYYVLDTTISATNFTQTLFPGSFQWRVKALNFGGETSFSEPFYLTIDPSSDLSAQIVALNSPADGIYSDDSRPIFSWQNMQIADAYIFEIKNGSNWNTGSLFFSDTISTTSIQLPVNNSLTEGHYCWGIQAINTLSSTNFTIRNIAIDLTAPPVVTLTSPAGNSVVGSGIVNFTWNRPSDIGLLHSPLTDTLFIFSDTIQNALFLKGGTPFSSFSVTMTNPGWHQWFVVSYDQAGNASDTSARFNFQVN